MELGCDCYYLVSRLRHVMATQRQVQAATTLYLEYPDSLKIPSMCYSCIAAMHLLLVPTVVCMCRGVCGWVHRSCAVNCIIVDVLTRVLQNGTKNKGGAVAAGTAKVTRQQQKQQQRKQAAGLEVAAVLLVQCCP